MDYVTGTSRQLGGTLMRDLGSYRHQVFVDHLGWTLPDAARDAEWDRFDRADTIYVLALDVEGKITGCARLLPTTKPYLLSVVFPQLGGEEPLPMSPTVWELSRFAAFDLTGPPAVGHTLGSPQALQLLRVAREEAGDRGAERLVSVSPVAIERILRRARCPYRRMASPQLVDGHLLFACEMPTASSVAAEHLEALSLTA